MSDELKPCPLCGWKATIEGPDGDTCGMWKISCPNMCRVEVVAERRDWAVRRWNTRPVEDALRAERDAALAKVTYLESALESAENDTHKAQRAFHELDGKWESVPWQAFRIWAGHVDATTVEDIEEATNTIEAWVCAHAPQPQGEEARNDPQPTTRLATVGLHTT